MFKVYFDPKTLVIKGVSSKGTVMDFPYVVTKTQPILIDNWKIEMEDGEPKLKPIKMSFTNEEWKAITNP